MPRYTTFVCELCLAIDPNNCVVQHPSDRRRLRIKFVSEGSSRSNEEKDVMMLCREHEVAMRRYLSGPGKGNSMAKRLATVLIHGADVLQPEDSSV